MLFQSGIQVGHVSVVMLPVMDFHRHLVDVRFERVGRVRKRRKCVSHRNVLLVDEQSDLKVRTTTEQADLKVRTTTAVVRAFRLARSRESYYEMESMRSSATLVQCFWSAGTTIRLWTSPAIRPSRIHKRWLGDTRNIVEQRQPNCSIEYTVRTGCTCCASRLTRWISVPTPHTDPAGLDFT